MRRPINTGHFPQFHDFRRPSGFSAFPLREARRIKRGFSQGRGRRCGHGAAQNRMLGSARRGSFRNAHGFERVDLQTGRNHQAWKRTTAKAVGRLSELGEFVLSVVASRSHRRGTRWQAEGVENLPGYDGIFDGCQNSHPRAAADTPKHPVRTRAPSTVAHV